MLSAPSLSAKPEQPQSEIQITDLHRRAMHRFVEEEAHRQKNIEEITSKALPQLDEGAKPDAMEDDWVTNFFDKSRIVSDGEMQNLWSRVLAGEANAPGTYSKRTVNFLSDLDRVDAEMFAKLCGFGWGQGAIFPLIFDGQADIYTRNGISFYLLNHLESIGLAKYNGLSEFNIGDVSKTITMAYYGRALHLEMPKDNGNSLRLGHVILTKIGSELAPICGSAPVDGFWEYVSSRWKEYLPKAEAPLAASGSPR